MNNSELLFICLFVLLEWWGRWRCHRLSWLNLGWSRLSEKIRSFVLHTLNLGCLLDIEVKNMDRWWSLEFRRKLWTKDRNLKVAIVPMVFKFMRLDEVVRIVSINREEKIKDSTLGHLNIKRPGKETGGATREVRGECGVFWFKWRKCNQEGENEELCSMLLMNQRRWRLKTDCWA